MKRIIEDSNEKHTVEMEIQKKIKLFETAEELSARNLLRDCFDNIFDWNDETGKPCMVTYKSRMKDFCLKHTQITTEEGSQEYILKLVCWGMRYHYGISIKRDCFKSMDFFKKFLKIIHVDDKELDGYMKELKGYAFFMIARNLRKLPSLDGRLHNKLDGKRIRKYYRAAIRMENSAAMVRLADLHSNQHFSTKLDESLAFTLYRKAAELGHKEARYVVYEIYTRGFGNIEQNFEKAAFHLEKIIGWEFMEGTEFNELLHTGEVKWREEYHYLWTLGWDEDVTEDLHKQILTLLMISKKRNESKIKESCFLIKGIVMMIIRFICEEHYKTKSPESIISRND